MLGTAQEAFVTEAVEQADTTWHLLGNPVVLAGVDGGNDTDGPAYYLDTWDGFPSARHRLIDTLAGADNPVVLTGDYHAGMVLDVHQRPFEDSPVVAPEFMAPAISSPLFPADVSARTPHLRQQLNAHGYLRVDVEPERLTATFKVLGDVQRSDSPIATAATWVVDAGDPVTRPALNRVDVVVVGAGAMGSSTAWWLARRGRSVALLEQFERGHVRGSSHGGTRIFRFAYPDPAYVRMAQEALPLWRELEDDAGRTLLEITGAVDHGEPTSVAATADALAACGAAHSLLTPLEAAERWPHMRFEGRVLFHPDGGRCLAGTTVATLHERAAAHGAEVRFGAGPAAVATVGDGVEVRAGDESWQAPVAVLTVGGWLPSMRPGFAARVTREHVQHFRPRSDATGMAVVHPPPPAVGVRAPRRRRGHEDRRAPRRTRGRPRRRGPGRGSRAPRAGGALRGRVVPRRGPRAAARRPLRVHDDRGRVVRARAPRPGRRRLPVLRPRLQVHAAHRPAPRRPGDRALAGS